MIDGLEKLKQIGAQKIHETTHIAKYHVQEVLHESFDTINKIQLLGFISILEREYSVNLDELKEKGMAHFDQIVEEEKTSPVFASQQKKKTKSSGKYVVILIALFVLFVAYTISSLEDSSNTTSSYTLDESIIEDAKKNIDINSAVDTKAGSLALENNESKINTKAITKTFKITPRRELWMGYIDLATHKKYQKIFSDEIKLDANKEWLFSLGHGNIDVEINGVTKEYSSKRTVRYVYKNGVFRQIRFAEFRTLNRGDTW